MNISPRAIIRIGLAAAVMLAAILFVHLRNANGASPPSDSASAGHRLAQAWCKDCHTIDATTAGVAGHPPDFAAIANRHRPRRCH
jgi:mono/diheme cytochrome c family protein